MSSNTLKTHDHTDPLRVLDQLRGYERDLRARLATRVAELGHPGAPISDPIYQRLFLALESIEAQRAMAEGAFARHVDSLVD